MSELPKGWAESNFDDVCDYIQRGKSPKYVEYSDYPVVNQKAIRWFGIQEEHLKYINPEQWPKWDEQRYICIGDILWNSTGTGTIGRACHIDETQYTKAKVVDSHVTIVRTNKYIDSKFAFYWVMHPEIQGNINGLYNGSTNQVELSKKIVQSTKFLLAPLNEQQRIVEKLDDVLAQVDAIKGRLDSIPNIIKRFRQSVLANAVSGKLTEEWRGACLYTNINEIEVPSSWSVEMAKDICEKVQSGSTPRNDPFNQGGTVPFLKVYNIVNQEIDFDYKPQFILQDVHTDKLKRSIGIPGDVVMNIVGPPLGKVAILPKQYEEWNLNQAITLFRPLKECLVNKFLYFVLCEGALVRKVMPETKGSVGQVNISLTQCREAQIPLPPVEEQTEIVRLVDEYFALADTIEAQVNKARARVDNLTQSILAKAFRGELVPQDENDEPADKLLERIAQAKAEAEALAKAAKKAETAKKRAAKTISK